MIVTLAAFQQAAIPLGSIANCLGICLCITSVHLSFKFQIQMHHKMGGNYVMRETVSLLLSASKYEIMGCMDVAKSQK